MPLPMASNDLEGMLDLLLTVLIDLRNAMVSLMMPLTLCDTDACDSGTK